MAMCRQLTSMLRSCRSNHEYKYVHPLHMRNCFCHPTYDRENG